MRVWRRLGLRARATVAWALIAFVLAGGLAVLAYQLTRQQLVDDRRDQATAQTYLNARLLRSGLRAPDPEIAALLASLEANVGSAALARVDGQWYSGAVGVSQEALPSALVEVVDEGRAGRQVGTIAGEPHIVVGVPIGEVDAAYFELVPMDDIDASLESLARRLAVSAGIAAVLAAVAGWYASGRVLRPLRTMAGAAAEIADGNLDIRLDGTRDPDLEPLQSSFNQMADAIEERIQREHRFTSDVSHELRSPLAAMLSAIEIAKRRATSDGDVTDALAQLETRTQAFRELVSELLEISRVDAGVAELNVEPVEPEALVCAVLRLSVGSDVPIVVDGSAPPTVYVDKRRVGQMVMNLVDNANCYAGGVTRIELSGDRAVLRIAVEDDGPGIPEHERRHVFGRFARGDDARHSNVDGTGLGLSLVAEHERLHGGRAWVEDAPSGGARFVIELPVGVEPCD